MSDREVHSRGARFLKLAGTCVAAVGALPLLWTLALGSASRQVGWSVDIPLNGVGGVGVADDGTIFCLREEVQRVQRYDPSGRFVGGWGFHGGGGVANLAVTERTVVVTTARGESRYVYSFDGVLAAVDRGTWRSLPVSAVDSVGRLYFVRSPWFFPRLVRVDDGKESVVIGADLRWPFFAQRLALIVAGIGIVLRILGSRKAAARRSPRGAEVGSGQ